MKGPGHAGHIADAFLSPSPPVSLPLSRCHFNDSTIGHIYRKSHVSASVSRIRWMEVMVRQDECGVAAPLSLSFSLSLSLSLSLSFSLFLSLLHFFVSFAALHFQCTSVCDAIEFPDKTLWTVQHIDISCRGRSYVEWRYDHTVRIRWSNVTSTVYFLVPVSKRTLADVTKKRFYLNNFARINAIISYFSVLLRKARIWENTNAYSKKQGIRKRRIRLSIF